MGTVKYGKLQGVSFQQLIDSDPEGYLGKALCAEKEFPLLIKLIDANDDLSVQVHPPGVKNEVWYIVHAREGARLNAGLVSGTRREDFATAMGSREIEKYLNFIPVKTGDVINIPAGTVHAIGSGLVIAEIQQNSDTTYRVYDYGRVDDSGKPRQLHIEEALESIDFGASCGLQQGQSTDVPGGRIVLYCMTQYYVLYEYFVETSIRENSDPDRFFILTNVDGFCEIRTSGYSAVVAAGESVFIPAALGSYELFGRCRLLKSYVP
jgi:mannose-6-phosphate isomerase